MCQVIIAFGTLRVLGWELPLRVFGYGLMLVLGFLAAIFLTQWRAKRVGESPETISQIAILALLGGIFGARLAYVIEDWDHFRNAPFGEIFNVTSGGLIYFGGLLLATVAVLVFLFLKRLPVRRYLDILAPGIMLGLAFGRAGCLMNGCCWGGPCEEHWALSARFPMVSRPLLNFTGNEPYAPGQSLSPAYADQYWNGQTMPDARLLNASVMLTRKTEGGKRISRPAPLPVEQLHGRLSNDQLVTLLGSKEAARVAFDRLAGEDGVLSLAEWNRGRESGDGFLRGSEAWNEAAGIDRSAPEGFGLRFQQVWDYLQIRRDMLLQAFDADRDGKLLGPEREKANAFLQADLYELLAVHRTNPLRPAQLLGMVNGVLMCLLLLAFFRHRRREGQVFFLMLILYPMTRFLLESIRHADSLNVTHGHWTHNQISAVCMVIVGFGLWWWSRKLPASSGPTLAQRMAMSDSGPHCGRSETRNRT
jgi:prolipoprotein diacylglyceryltransferase